MTRYICIHGHFYQPMRENPWTGMIDKEESADPYPNWNARIFAECYGPNISARLLDAKGNLRKTVNNYKKISFDMGPTLLKWMAEWEHPLYQCILNADQASLQNIGSGSAMAQSYHHSILPLCDVLDQRTEIEWGVVEFFYRFKRLPQGMWLPETAVNNDTLEMLVQMGIQYVLLAPQQAKEILHENGVRQNLREQPNFSTHQAYRVDLPSGKHMDVFFYEGAISHEIAFNHLLNNGDLFAERLLASFSPEQGENPFLVVATDGESYGHHHRYGEMALARCIERLEAEKDVVLTNCSDYLQKFPPQKKVELHENSSWSCAHGVGRWKEDCGCAIEPQKGWNQKWRKPLREALEFLRNRLRKECQHQTNRFVKDFWAARNDYIQYLLHPTLEAENSFIERHTHQVLSRRDRQLFMTAMEIQRLSLAMFTSCGWFFDDVSGLEATQNLRFAKRALELAVQEFGLEEVDGFFELLESAKSNHPEITGRTVFEEILVVDIPEEPLFSSSFAHLPAFSLPKPSKKRLGGVLMHPSSLPNKHGIGDLGGSVYDFIDWLKETGCRIWQVLPLVPTDDTGSPYGSCSSMAGNPMLIHLEQLQEKGLLAEIPEMLGSKSKVDFKAVQEWKEPLLRKAALQLLLSPEHSWYSGFQKFKQSHPWVEAFGWFRVFHREYQKAWWEWPKEKQEYHPEKFNEWRRVYKEEHDIECCIQYFFERQWQKVRTYCHRNGIQILGDLPIYVSSHSVDVWTSQHLFRLDEMGKPSMVAGVPPDAFSETGQLWGNPLYHWEEMQRENYAWWAQRVERMLQQVDWIRLDHFRGFESYWEVPANALTAMEGRWKKGPGADFFSSLQDILGGLPFFAEDLGIIDQKVDDLREEFGLASMRVLQFAFDGNPKNVHLPYNFDSNSVVYTGTHDNNTTLGWWNELDPESQHRLRFYMGVNGNDVVWDCIRQAFSSVAKWAIVPMQDYLTLDQKHRMNTPGTVRNNWAWRMPSQEIDSSITERIQGLLRISGRFVED